MQIFFPQDLPDPGPFASKDDWAAYYAQMWPAYSAFMQNSGAEEVTSYRNKMLDFRRREVVSVEATQTAQRELFTQSIDHMKFEKEQVELAQIAKLVEARATDRTASGAIDQAKVTKDVREILAIAKLLQAEQHPVPPPTEPPATDPPGLLG